MGTMIRPFSNGTQYMDWLASNCERCKKATWDLVENFKCDLQEALDMACIGTGEITNEQSKRIGINENTKNSYVWPCSEVEWTKEWKSEYLAMQNNGEI